MKRNLFISLLCAVFVCCAYDCYARTKVGVKNNSLYFGGELVGELTAESCKGVSYSDQVKRIDANTIKVVRTFEATEDVESARLTLNFSHATKCSYAMIPSVCYNGNQWGRGKEPKGFQTDGVWHSYSYRRTSIPGATFSEGERFAVAMWGAVPTTEEQAFSCSIMPEAAKTTHSLILPEEERPFTYISKDVYGKPFAKQLSLKKGEQRVLEAYIHISPRSSDAYNSSAFLDKAWELADKEYADIATAEELWGYGIKYAKDYLWAEEGEYKGLSIGLVTDKNGGWKQRPFVKYEIGWCGQNSSFINSLLVDYLKTNDETSKQKALATLDTWTSPKVLLKNGFYQISYDRILRGTISTVSDACNLGTAAYNFFETIKLLEKCGESDRIARVKEVALAICDFVKRDQLPSGVYGKGWNSSGECLYRDGTVGAFLVTPMLMAYEATGDKSYYTSAIRAFDYYYAEFVKNNYTTAGALDTWCIDKESSISLLHAAVKLYDVTGDKRYIENAERISYYLSTWVWHYNARYDDDKEVERLNFTTFGATSVSVQHHHLDIYALLWVGEWLRLAELTGNKVWRSKALAVWSYGCQLVSDGELEINNRVRPIGSQNEAFFNCNWQHSPGKPRINDWLVAWPGAFRLEVLRHLSDWDDLDKRR